MLEEIEREALANASGGAQESDGDGSLGGVHDTRIVESEMRTDQRDAGCRPSCGLGSVGLGLWLEFSSRALGNLEAPLLEHF